MIKDMLVRRHFFIIECTLDEESIKQRLAQRLEQGSASDGRWEIYEPQEKAFEAVVEVPSLDWAGCAKESVGKTSVMCEAYDRKSKATSGLLVK